MKKLRSVKGMHDHLPTDTPRWHRLEDAFRRRAEAHGYGEVRVPVLEPTALFVRSIGEVTDIVEKEMYTFRDKAGKGKEGELLTLRPEGTASCVRAYIQHAVSGQEPVSKWYYLGPMYRRERPAKGRYRQFYQAGCEVYGDPGPFVDAELIDMVMGLFAELGISQLEVVLNSLGSGDTRALYRDALLDYLRPHAASLSEDSQRRLERNPLRVLDSKAPQDQKIAANAPVILEFLDDDDKTHFESVQASLKALGTPFRVDPHLVRGLDYYTRTLFEIKGTGGELGAQSTLCGGGRYDGMIEQLGGKPTPAIGFAMGLERILHVAPDLEVPPRVDAVLVVVRPELRSSALPLAKQLRDAGVRLDFDLRGTSLKSQMRRADKGGARYALVLGEGELERGTIQVKDLKGEAEQKELSLDEVKQLLS